MADSDVKINVKDVDLDPLEEFDVESSRAGTLFGVNIGKTVKGAVNLEYKLITAPLNILPKKTRIFAKQTTLKVYKSLWSVVDGVNDAVEEILITSLEKDKAKL